MSDMEQKDKMILLRKKFDDVVKPLLEDKGITLGDSSLIKREDGKFEYRIIVGSK